MNHSNERDAPETLLRHPDTYPEVSFVEDYSQDYCLGFSEATETKYEDRWDVATYVTAHSTMTGNTFYTAADGANRRANLTNLRLKESDEYAKLLKSKALWPVDASIEQDWSGRGQHVEFDDTAQERDHINDVLKFQKLLGTATTATVQSVICRRILLARKTIICSKRMLTKSEAINEVAHLNRLCHAHVLRVIGTYVIGKELSILLYPVAEYNLESFLDIFHEYCEAGVSKRTLYQPHIGKMGVSCRKFFFCLADAVKYVHSRITKHMDIKPQNLLVKAQANGFYDIYIGDFGISRSYQNTEASNTDGPTSFTFKYAAPEVVLQEERGMAADIFSLGCVYFEMYEALQLCYYLGVATFNGFELQPEDGRVSYQSNIERLEEYISKRVMIHMRSASRSFCFFGLGDLTILPAICWMTRRTAEGRPCAAELVERFSGPFGIFSCCTKGSVKLEAHVSSEISGLLGGLQEDKSGTASWS